MRSLVAYRPTKIAFRHLLIYAGNSILMSEYASAIALEDRLPWVVAESRN